MILNPTPTSRDALQSGLRHQLSQLIGAKLQGVTYGILPAPTSVVFAKGGVDEVDFAVNLLLGNDGVRIDWGQVGHVEGLAVQVSSSLPAEWQRVTAHHRPPWRKVVGRSLDGVDFAWHSNPSGVEAIAAVSFRFNDEPVIIALGEIWPQGQPTYIPDSLLVFEDSHSAMEYVSLIEGRWGSDD